MVGFLILAVVSVFAAGLNITVGPGFAAGADQVPPGCDEEVDTSVVVATAPAAGTFPMTGVQVSEVDAVCDGQLVTVTALDSGGGTLGVAYGTADASGTTATTFLSPLANAAVVDSLAVVIRPSAAQMLSATTSGTVMIRQPLTATGVAIGGPTPVLSYQWQRSFDNGGNWSDIGGATESTYLPQDGDYELLLRVAITATNAGGSSTAYSAATMPVDGYAPINTQVSTSGTASLTCETVSAFATFDAGPAASITYQWQRSANGASGWADIDGATNASYTPTDPDYRQYLRVVVTGTNPEGSATAASPATAQVAGCAAQVTGSVSMTGSAFVGSTLTVTHGAFGMPTPTRTYAWQRSTDAETWADIAGTEASDTSTSAITYTPVAGDVGYRLRVRVTETNPVGTETKYSAFTLPVSATQITSIGDVQLDYAPTYASVSPLGGSQVDAAIGIGATIANGVTHRTSFSSAGTAATWITWTTYDAADPASAFTATLHNDAGDLVATASFSASPSYYYWGTVWSHTLSFGNQTVGPGYQIRLVNNSGRTHALNTSIYTYPTVPIG